jgi:HSP20 family protein
LRERASGALTRFTRHGSALATTDDDDLDPAWALLAGDVYEDGHKIVVRLEVPGLDKSDFHIQVTRDTLIVSGEKRFEREAGEGRYRVLQCAYGSFQRAIGRQGELPERRTQDRAAQASTRTVSLSWGTPGRSAKRVIPVSSSSTSTDGTIAGPSSFRHRGLLLPKR